MAHQSRIVAISVIQLRLLKLSFGIQYYRIEKIEK